ncbi:MAG: signal peptidase II [Gammaproteobacteria bacterium]|jgi:signal peptidase II|uniref:signal peptidase II n=1 Tax=Rhodoferax sp. TaxID=50421 RepID=UPI0018418401|nr:signal peptidase II [Rhodoferax sp.]MBU3899238.1 signal peptidase II [Gammaproteobacteria bacterium]MBA3058766.1 signal peptidase II [Rhodoferax sp.]MBU3999370.1 signal peptidase II [Gammaproteobacteria bacterium]MBU4082038.1 signal peptidase II [Gammaproteobacteria bacterium]MBU4172745.1 signal peptidase II [Gammaproteobacteria bacterium]
MFLTHWRQRQRTLWVILVVTLIGLDQLTKTYFANTIALGEANFVTDWFNLVHALNKGAAFSFLANADGWQRPLLIGVSILVIVPVTLVCMFKKTESIERWAGGLVVAGGTSNLIDRIQTGAVVDFLDLHWRGWHWPAFNLADSYIVCAVFVWVLLFRNTTPAHVTPTKTKAQA